MSQILYPLLLTDDAEPLMIETEPDRIADDAALLVTIARQIPAACNILRQHESAGAPFVLDLEDTHRRSLRVVICVAPDALQHAIAHRLPFVGFVSQTQSEPSRALAEAIARADQQLVAQLGRQSHVLAYCSLDLGDGAWCNLVLFRDEAGKSAVTGMPGHHEAAHRLAPNYYRWIRLHHGSIDVASEQPRLWLERTKFYTFSSDSRASVRTEVYTEAAATRTALQAAQRTHAEHAASARISGHGGD